jgi:hypothetical protein
MKSINQFRTLQDFIRSLLRRHPKRRGADAGDFVA